MKKLLKKNQIIITALAIMIAIAGYLNLTKEDFNDEPQTASMNSSDIAEYEQFTQDEGVSSMEYADISDENIAAGGIMTAEHEISDVSTTGAIELMPPEPGQLVEETGTDSSVPGEAVLASTTINPNFFSSAKLTREQTRSRTKEMLMNLIADTTVSEVQKQDAIDGIVALAEIAEKENATELLLEAKGFDGAVVSIIDQTVDVVVNAESITTRQVAQIEDIVMRKTGADAGEITIMPVIVTE